MPCSRLSHWMTIKISGLILLFATLACGLPFQPLFTLPSELNPLTEESEIGDVPSKVLTEVAATLFSPQQATFTAQVIEPSTTNPPAQAETPTIPTARAALAPSIVTPFPTANQPAVPPVSFAAQTGKDINITTMSLQYCGGYYSANFLVENSGMQALESLSLQLMDLNNDQDISDPNVTNVPFMESDRTCTPGIISHLEPGSELYTGGSLGPDQLSGHKILANILFCTLDDLNGQCYPRSVEFTIP